MKSLRLVFRTAAAIGIWNLVLLWNLELGIWNFRLNALLRLLDRLTFSPYFSCMQATITSKGQITIPMKIRQKFHLNPGDRIEFDENAPTLTARRVVDRRQWKGAIDKWRNAADKSLKAHPWKEKTSGEIVAELRDGTPTPKFRSRN